MQKLDTISRNPYAKFQVSGSSGLTTALKGRLFPFVPLPVDISKNPVLSSPYAAGRTYIPNLKFVALVVWALR